MEADDLHPDTPGALAEAFLGITETLVRVEQTLEDLQARLLEQPGPAFRLRKETIEEIDPRRLHAALFRFNGPDDAPDGRYVWECPGILMAVPDLEAELTAVNAAKNAFREALKPVSGVFMNQDGLVVRRPPPAYLRHTVNGDVQKLPDGVYPALRWHLARNLGRGMLNVNQVYRSVNLLEHEGQAPDSLGFGWRHKRAVHRVQAAEIRGQLERNADLWKRHPEAGAIDHFLNAVPDREWLARVLEKRPFRVVQGRWKTADASGRAVEKSALASIPVLVPWRPGDALPRLRAPKRTLKHPRIERHADRVLEPYPVIPALRLYRYRSEFRR